MPEKVHALPAPASAIEAMPRSGIRAIMELALERPGTLNLGFGEPDFDTPPHIVEAAATAAREGKTRYTPSRGVPELREAAAQRLRERNGMAVTADQVIATVGGVQAVFAALAALCDPGDAVLVPDPAWPNYVGHCILLGLRPVRYRLDAAAGFEPDLDELNALAASAGARLLITNTPSNPTGGVWRRDAVEGALRIAERHGLWVIADEVYDEMAFDGEHVPMAPMDGDGRVVAVYSLSKTYAMTGWRLGYLAAPVPIVAVLNKVPESIVSCPSAPSQWAGVAALTGPQACVGEMRAAYRSRRDLAVAALRAEGLFVAEPKGAFYAFADISAATLDTDRFARHLVAEHGVACAPGDTFGPGGAGLLRLSLAAAPDIIAEAIRRIGAAVRGWQG
jgi:aspartate aminotransferase